MYRAGNITSLLVFAILMALPIGLSAQVNWGQIATPATIGFGPVCMDAADGIVVVGGPGIAVSTNNGSTWRNVSPNVGINPNFLWIAIYDRNIFAVQSGASQIYITYDQGTSWRRLLYSSPVIPQFPLIFLNDPEKILCMSNGGFLYTTNGGLSFTTTTTSLNPYQFKMAANGTLRLFSRTDDDVRTASSSDTGKTWVTSTVLPYKDCFSMIADPANANLHCLINEDFFFDQHGSRIFRTSDNGATWDTTLTQGLDYLAGSSTLGCTDYFVGTFANGILRSTDQGASWHGIGGPSVSADFHNLVAADDSLIFAISTTNVLWATRPASYTWKIRVRSDIPFTREDIAVCDSVHFGNVIIYPGCSTLGIQRANFIGVDANRYRFLDSADAMFPDTLRIKFTSSGVGTTQATLKVVLDDSTSYDFDLSATTIAPEMTLSPDILMQDTVISYCDLLSDTIQLRSPCPMSVTSMVLFGMDSASFTILNPGTKTLPGDSNIIVVCTPKRLGQLDAQIRFTTQYGRTHFISLRPFIRRIPLRVFFDTLFAKDTLLMCRNGRDTIRINSPCIVGNMNIALTDSTDYRILTKRTLNLPQDSVIIVEYNSNGKTNISSYLTFRSTYLDSVNVPLRRSFKRAPVSLKTTPRIEADTFSFCRTVFDTIRFRSDCPYYCLNFRFEGPDALKFKIIGKYLYSLPNDSALIISCSAVKPGQLNADLVFETNDGVTNRFKFRPTFVTSPLSLSPSVLFAGDSIGICAGGFDTLRLSSDCPLNVKSISITGVNSSSFKLMSIAPLQLPKDSLIIVECLGGILGRRIGALRIELEDGRVWSIQLSALVVNAPIKIVPAALFTNDSISVCSFGLDTVRLIGPCPLALRSVTIQGNDAALFQIVSAVPLSLPGDSIVVIRCTPSKSGILTAYLRIEAEDGRVWSVPFTPHGIKSTLQSNKPRLFDRDTIVECSALNDSIILSVDCPLQLVSLSVVGQDATSFSVVGPLSRMLPQDSEVVVRCSPTRTGQLDASLHMISEDGRTWDFPISMSVVQAPFSISPSSLFENDSIYICSSVTDTLVFSSDCPLNLTEISISGVDAGSFGINTSQAQYPDVSQVIVTCTPSHLGALSAMLLVRSSDGRTWNIPLSLFAKDAPLEISSATLFGQDSLSVCDKIRDTLYLHSLCPLGVSSVNISGIDQGSFTIVGSIPDSLPRDSMLVIECIPQHSGPLQGVVTVTTSEGRRTDISLLAYAFDRATISFEALTDVSTDTLGGDIVIPIAMLATGGIRTIEFTLHFDPTQLEYKGVYDELNLDKTVTSAGGRSRVSFDTRSGSQLYALFSYYPVGTNCTQVFIDSITTEGGATSCLTNLTASLSANVCSDSYCGRDAITNFLRYGSGPDLSIMPNPSAGNILLRADEMIEDATIEIIDAYGVVAKLLSGIRVSTIGVVVETEGLASGVYQVHVRNGLVSGVARLILMK